MTEMAMGARLVGAAHPPYVIAEIGANHNGDMGLCKELIFAAKEAGADAVKFQSWSETSLIAESEYRRNEVYNDPHKHFGSLRDMVRAYQLTPEQHHEAASFCDDAGIDFLSSAFCKEEVDLLVSLEVPAIKIASMDLAHPELLRAVAATGIPPILSTGMGTMAEIAAAVDTLRAAGAEELAVLHCVSIYPVQPELLNVRNVPAIAAAFECPVGFSDHSAGFGAAVAAVALGACIIEKHFTLDRTMQGWDHDVSVEPHELAVLCTELRTAHDALGRTSRVVSQAELKKRESFRRSVVLRGALPAGHVLQAADLDYKRPGTGIPPTDAPHLVGRTLTVDLPHDHLVQWSEVS
jgi:N,N'-diacetyllegionaminate synthase